MEKVKMGGWILLALLGLLVVLAPLGPLPGVFIGGKATVSPAQWPDTSAVHEIQVAIPGTLPRVVILWVIQVDNELHIVGEKSSTWVSMIGEGSPVEMRLGGATYSLAASAVEENPESIYQAYLDKYRPDYPDLVSEFPSAAEGAETGVIFRLSRTP
ncbi:MAG: hypothetical protein P8Q97_08920 [Myxococcota bacterium]|nr:hypothetical protein [Myxococcota bacterium]